jgi:hypothetical protein
MIVVLAQLESTLESIETLRGALVEMEKVHELGDQLELPS